VVMKWNETLALTPTLSRRERESRASGYEMLTVQ